MILRPAITLREAAQTLFPEPLTTIDEIAAFYNEELNDIRGGDKVAELREGLETSSRRQPYKAYLVGFRGCGKSTELALLQQKTIGRFHYILFDAGTDLDPVSFKPFDVLLLMFIRLASETEKVTGTPPNSDLLNRLIHWYDETTETTTGNLAGEIKAETEGKVGTPGASWWPKIVEFFVKLRGEIKYSASREEKTVHKSKSRVNELITLMNDLIEECNGLLSEERSWVFIGDSFDKPNIPRKSIEDLFIGFRHILEEMNINMIFNIPPDLAFCEQSRELAQFQGTVVIPDTQVFCQDHTPDKKGREILGALLTQRMINELFAFKQKERLIVASGGNTRDLLSLTSQATMKARVRLKSNSNETDRIEKEDVDRVLADFRQDLLSRLGSSRTSTDEDPYINKAKTMVAIYHGEQNTDVPNSIVNQLLRVGAIQKFNGNWWFGVHPMVVSILWKQGHIVSSENGDLPGGLL